MQTAIANACRQSGAFQDVLEEVAWRDRDGTDRFIDMVAITDRAHFLIECKKSEKEQLVFLLPSDLDGQHSRYHLWCTALEALKPPLRPAIYWAKATSNLDSPHSAYCVTQQASGSQLASRLLERDVQPLVRGTDVYAIDRYRTIRLSHEHSSIALLPVLVTTAPMFVAEYDPAAISMEDGIFKAKKTDMRAVNYLRFTKEFTTTFRHQARRRTVLVVQSSAWKDLLPILSQACVGGDPGLLLHDSLTPPHLDTHA